MRSSQAILRRVFALPESKLHEGSLDLTQAYRYEHFSFASSIHASLYAVFDADAQSSRVSALISWPLDCCCIYQRVCFSNFKPLLNGLQSTAIGRCWPIDLDCPGAARSSDCPEPNFVYSKAGRICWIPQVIQASQDVCIYSTGLQLR